MNFKTHAPARREGTTLQPKHSQPLPPPINEHSKRALAPHTNGPRDLPRCGVLSLLQSRLTILGFKRIIAKPLCNGPEPSCCPRPVVPRVCVYRATTYKSTASLIFYSP